MGESGPVLINLKVQDGVILIVGKLSWWSWIWKWGALKCGGEWVQSSDCALKGRRRVVVELIEVRRHKSVGVLALGWGCPEYPQLRNLPPHSSGVGSWVPGTPSVQQGSLCPYISPFPHPSEFSSFLQNYWAPLRATRCASDTMPWTATIQAPARRTDKVLDSVLAWEYSE